VVSSRAGVILATFLVIVPMAFGAGTQKVASKITYQNSIAPPPNGYIHEGEVKSDLKKCERDRTVRLYGEGVDEPFGKDKTNADGEYRITLGQDGLVTDYYTRVRVLHKGSVTCKGAESKHKPLD